MKKALFDELVGSIKEAGRIHRGETKASRTFVFDIPELGAGATPAGRPCTSIARRRIEGAESRGQGIGGSSTSERLIGP
jgi:hypothetical protein